METKLYYEAPTDEVFNEVKEKAIEVWTERYPEATSPYYAKEKTDYLKPLTNVSDNVMTIVGMFDIENQRILADKLSNEAKTALRERMIDGGNEEWMIPF